MRKLKNNLFHIDKRASIIGITALLLLSVIVYFLFFNKHNIDIDNEEIIEATSLKLSIFNGCGVPKAASDVKENLLNRNLKNFDIIFCENVRNRKFIWGKSVIVVKRKNDNKLKYLMKITGVSRRIYAFDENTIEDFQLILGRDYRTYFK